MHKFKSKITLILLSVLVFALLTIPSKAGLSQTAVTEAKAEITGPNITGSVLMKQSPAGFVWLYVDIQGDPQVLTPGLHGFHLHQTGTCEPDAQPRFGTAGGHFDPGPFGSSTPVEANHPYHLGDLPNIQVDENGRGKLTAVTTRFTLSEGPVSVFDDDGSAFIVHGLRDEIKAGGTAAQSGGPRLACGVIEPYSSNSDS